MQHRYLLQQTMAKRLNEQCDCYADCKALQASKICSAVKFSGSCLHHQYLKTQPWSRFCLVRQGNSQTWIPNTQQNTHTIRYHLQMTKVDRWCTQERHIKSAAHIYTEPAVSWQSCPTCFHESDFLCTGNGVWWTYYLGNNISTSTFLVYNHHIKPQSSVLSSIRHKTCAQINKHLQYTTYI